MCVDVEDPWEVATFNPHAMLAEGEKEACYECGRPLQGVEHTWIEAGPLEYRECKIEDCDHLDCTDGEEFIDLSEGGAMRFCPQCVAARVWLEKVCRSWLYGGIHEDLLAHFEDEMRPIRSLPLGKIIVGARRQWCKRDGTYWTPEQVRSWAEEGAGLVAAHIAAGGKAP